MAQHIDDAKRQVVPRWRPFAVAASLGHLADPRRSRGSIHPSPGELEELERDWQRHPSRSHAMNLIDAAVVLSRPEIAESAARFLLSDVDSDTLSTSLARFVLGLTPTPTISPPPALTRQDRYRRIAEARRSLRQHPRNPILLVDLAREYSVLGQLPQAERAIIQAVSLAPENRFVLRSASRFYLHIGQPDMAHRILRRANRTPYDPWLLSAEIVAASASGRNSSLIKLGRGIVDSGGLQPMHTTELASALGTVELAHGNRRQVRKLFEHALIDPTENTVAQAIWVARHMPDFEVREDSLSVPRAYEAGAWTSAVEGRYSEAISKAWDWLRDEPFATRAALFGSWISGTANEDYRTAMQMITTAQIANPDDPRLIAQMIYCLASEDSLDEAEQLLTGALPGAILKHPEIYPDSVWRVIEAADRGLLAFRRKQISEARAYYLKAIELAPATGIASLRAEALLNLLREEMRANPTMVVGDREIKSVLNDIPSSLQPLFQPIVSRLLAGPRSDSKK